MKLFVVLGINSMKNKRTLRRDVFLYLIFYSLFVIIIIGVSQIIYLVHFYESSSINKLEKKIYKIEEEYKKNNSITEILDKYSYENNFCSELLIDNELSYSTNHFTNSCLNTIKNKETLLEARNKFQNSNEKVFRNILPLSKNNKMVIIGLKLDNNKTIYINDNIKSINSTISGLKNQFIIITIIIISISSLVAYYLTKKWAKKITDLTDKSIQLSKGNLNVNFNVDTGIIEMNELAQSLNYSKEVLKKNDELRRDLMANVSHDLKTPLTMIKAYAEMVRDFSYKDDIKRENDLNIIMDEVDRLNVLVNDILDLSKLENNIEELNIEEINISGLVDTIIGRFKIFSLTQDCKFITHYKKKIMVMADKQKLEQVIYNLISNAINYSNDKKNVYVTIIERKNEIRIFITDTGPGIKKEKINDIWDKYYKIDKKYKRNVIGTGLGLSIVKHIFDLHNYQYGIVSKEDLGTTFYFIINKKKNRKK